jgi:hypothetical protein
MDIFALCGTTHPAEAISRADTKPSWDSAKKGNKTRPIQQHTAYRG